MEEDIKILEEAVMHERKEQEALEKLIKAYKEYEECLEVTSQALNNIAYDQIPIAIGDLEAEIEKKDKIIDLMAENITDNANVYENLVNTEYEHTKEEVKEYFENKVKEE